MNYSLLVLMMSLILISCGKEDFFDKDKKMDIWEKDGQKSDETEKGIKDGDCFEMIFPVSVEMPNGDLITEDGAKELHASIKSWYENHPDFDGKYAFVYPIEISYPEFDKVFTINNQEEFIEAKKKCEKDGWKNKPCFEMIFPVSVEMPNGDIIIEDEKKELHTAIKSWYENHPDNKDKFDLVYPVEISFIGIDIIITINNEEEMIAAKKDCEK